MISKLREALLKADVLISIATFEEDVKKDEVYKLRSEIKAVISEPLRNCDVGTAEEQEKRYLALCDSNKCSSCPVRFKGKTDCVFTWEQMPYEEGNT